MRFRPNYKTITITGSLFLLFFLFFNSPARFLGTDDGYPARLIPISILKEGNFELGEFINNGQLNTYSIVDADGYYVSKYPILTSPLALPVYSIPFIFNITFSNELIAGLARISASLIVASSAILIYFIFRRFLSEKWSIILTIAYALGTSCWTISSQDLWQHGTSQLLLVLTIFFLLKALEKQYPFLLLVGLFAGLSIAARPINLIIVLFILIFVFHRFRNNFPLTLLGLLVPLILVAFYNTYYFGAPWSTGYGQEILEGWTYPIWQGFAGLLFSPSRGLFFFTPFLVFPIWGMITIWRKSLILIKDINLLFRYLSLGLIFYLLVLSKWWAWPGAYSYGPRMLTDIVPIMILFFIPMVRSGVFRKKILKSIFIVLITFSILVQLVGIIYYDNKYQGEYYFDNQGNKISLLWSLREGQLYFYLSKPFHYN